MDEFKINWSKEELEDLILEVELLNKPEFAGKCFKCEQQCPCVVRYAFEYAIRMACPQCCLDQKTIVEQKLSVSPYHRKSYLKEMERLRLLKASRLP